MTMGEFYAALQNAGCTFDPKLPQNDHIVIRCGGRKTVWPGHDQNVEVGKLIAEKVRADLALSL